MCTSVIEYKCKPNSATIKKFEYGIRNPKPDQLLKIANVEIKIHLVDDNMVVKKGTSGIIVKIFPQ